MNFFFGITILLLVSFIVFTYIRNRPYRQLVVWPAETVGTKESIRLHFDDGFELPMKRGEDGSFREGLRRELLEKPFVICRHPGAIPEKGFHGQDIPPRSAAVLAEPLWIFPPSWAGTKPDGKKLRRVGPHEDFPVEVSKRIPDPRMVRVHLPQDYEENKTGTYPLVYLLDGQNVFDAATAFGGVEWSIDEIAQRFFAEDEISPILVAIDNGQARREYEYTFCTIDGEENRSGAEEHLSFILEELDPIIRSRYRVEEGPAALLGSSLGGLFVLWAAIQHPSAFRALAAISPSVWWGKGKILRLSLASGPIPKLWVCMGTNEGKGAEKKYSLLCSRLAELGWIKGKNFRSLLVKGAYHHESAWADRSPTILRYLCRDSF